MNNPYRQAAIYVQNAYVGIVRETEEGYSFQYEAEYLIKPNAISVSLTLPLSEKEYKSKTLFSFFDGMIPEGWLLDIASRNWKLDRNDRFGLLLVCCRDCIGDVSVREVAHEV